MKFRKKPVVIHAFKWEPKKELEFDCELRTEDMLHWISENGGDAAYSLAPDYIIIDTLEGTMKANPGDWIIKGVKEEFYPCKPAIFDATYEIITQDEDDK